MGWIFGALATDEIKMKTDFNGKHNMTFYFIYNVMINR